MLKVRCTAEKVESQMMESHSLWKSKRRNVRLTQTKVLIYGSTKKRMNDFRGTAGQRTPTTSRRGSKRTRDTTKSVWTVKWNTLRWILKSKLDWEMDMFLTRTTITGTQQLKPITWEKTKRGRYLMQVFLRNKMITSNKSLKVTSPCQMQVLEVFLQICCALSIHRNIMSKWLTGFTQCPIAAKAEVRKHLRRASRISSLTGIELLSDRNNAVVTLLWLKCKGKSAVRYWARENQEMLWRLERTRANITHTMRAKGWGQKPSLSVCLIRGRAMLPKASNRPWSSSKPMAAMTIASSGNSQACSRCQQTKTKSSRISWPKPRDPSNMSQSNKRCRG